MFKGEEQVVERESKDRLLKGEGGRQEEDDLGAKNGVNSSGKKGGRVQEKSGTKKH